MLLAYDIPKENVTAIKILNKNKKAMVRLLDGHTDFVNIVAGVLRGDTLVLILQTSSVIGFKDKI